MQDWDERGGSGDRCGGRRAVLDDLEVDDSESPAIGVVPAGVPWEEIEDHIKIAHQPLVVFPAGASEYAGIYWTGTAIAVVEDLGSDHDQAISEFRISLRERGEA
jgi:hypothetical protein